jgi:SAM-dependent methyltransferase
MTGAKASGDRTPHIGRHMQALEAIGWMLPPRLRGAVGELADAAFTKQRALPRPIRERIVDEEYARGRWDYLNDLEEMTRYAVIIGYCEYGGDVSSVLDLGCGVGILRRWLRPLEAVEYVGVDLSNVAIETARRDCTDAKTTFVTMDVATFVPDRKFDVIVFNEVLYYFEHPDEILRRFATSLAENGRFVISLWDSPESRRAWRRSRGDVHILDEVQIRHRSGVAWQIRLCRPRASAQ